MNITVDVEGEKEVIASIEKATADLLADVEGVVQETLSKIEREAKKNVPVDEGDLRASIRQSLEDAAGYFIQGKVIAGDEDADYAVYIEHGTGKHAKKGDGRKTPWVYFDEKRGRFVTTEGNKPQPFLAPAFKKHIPFFKRELRRVAAKYA